MDYREETNPQPSVLGQRTSYIIDQSQSPRFRIPPSQSCPQPPQLPTPQLPTSNVFHLFPGSELRLLLLIGTPLKVRLLPAPPGHPLPSAEISGFQLPHDAECTFHESGEYESWAVSIWSWTGASIDARGPIKRHWIVPNRAIEEASNAHSVLQAQRSAALECLSRRQFRDSLEELRRQCRYSNNHITPDPTTTLPLFWSFIQKHLLSNDAVQIPRVLILGPFTEPSMSHDQRTPSSQFIQQPVPILYSAHMKMALAHSLCGWSRRSESYPVLVELDHAVPTLSQIEALQFPPGVIGAIQISDMTAFGYKVPNYSEQSKGRTGESYSYVTSGTLPCLYTRSEDHSILEGFYYYLGQTKKNDDLFRHHLQGLNSAMVLSMVQNVIKLFTDTSFLNSNNLQLPPDEQPMALRRLASGWIVNGPSDITFELVKDIIGIFNINTVFVMENTQLLKYLCSHYAFQLPTTKDAAAHLPRPPVVIVGLKALYPYPPSKDLSRLTRAGWLDYFFGRLGPRIARAPQTGVVTCMGRPLGCLTARVPLSSMKIVSLEVDDKQIESLNDGQIEPQIGLIKKTVCVECVPFSDHPASLLGRVLGVVTTPDAEWEAVRGFVCVKSIDSTSSQPEEPNTMIMLELIVAASDLPISSIAFLKTSVFIVGGSEMIVDLTELTMS